MIHCLCLPLVIATGTLGTEIIGKVTAVSGDTVTIAADAAKAQARTGDSVAIYFQIPGLDDLAKVGSGQVVSVEAPPHPRTHRPAHRLARGRPDRQDPGERQPGSPAGRSTGDSSYKLRRLDRALEDRFRRDEAG